MSNILTSLNGHLNFVVVDVEIFVSLSSCRQQLKVNDAVSEKKGKKI